MSLKRAFVVMVLLAGGCAPLPAPAECLGMGSIQVEPFAYEDVTVSTVAVGFTAATYAPTGYPAAAVAVVTVDTAAIRYRADGSNPTAAVGHPAAASQELVVCGVKAIAAFRAIRSGASDATLRVTYYRSR